MTDKDIEITVTALMKSIIESGAPKEEWKELLQEHAIPLYTDTTNQWKQQETRK